MVILNIEPATNFSGGVNQTIINSIYLKQAGHEVVVACQKDSPVHKRLKDNGIECIFIEEKEIFKSAAVIRNFLSKRKVDIVHTHHPRGHKIGLWATFFKDVKLVVQRSVLFPTVNLFKYHNPRVNMFIANSYAVKEVLRKYFVPEKKIRVVYSCVDNKRLEKYPAEDVKKEFGFEGVVFGVVGNYSSFKGHDIALEAFGVLKDKATLVFVGRDTEKLKDKAAAMGVLDRVKILGFRADATRIMNGFDVLIVPSLLESFPNVAVEAFFLGVPVIGNNVGGIKELLGGGRGILVNPTSESLKEAMKSFLNMDKEKINSMTKKAFEFAQNNLTPQSKIKRLIEVYQEGLND